MTPKLNATCVAIETLGQVGVKVGVKAKVGIRKESRKVGKPFNFRGLNASIFLIFFFNMSRISRGVHFSALEYLKMKCKGCTHRTMASTTVHMNTYTKPTSDGVRGLVTT